MAFYFEKSEQIFNRIILVIIAILTISEIGFSRVTSRKLISQDMRFLDVKMNEVKPTKNDDYLCTAMSVSNNDLYVVQFEPHADQSRVHHMLLFGCTELYDNENISPGYWNCGHSQLCPGMSIMYAWGKNAPALYLPQGVGFKIGSKTSVNYVILQVHYAHVLPNGESDSSGVTLHYTYAPQEFIAGIHLLSSNTGVIPPHKEKYSIDINCLMKESEPIYPFAYRVHAHALGVVITGYKYTQQNDSWALLAKGNPQWPQAFYPMEQIHKVDRGDILSARCTYNSSSRSSITLMGSTSNDEMCNLYIMYYTNAKVGHPFGLCVDTQFRDLTTHLPVGSDEPLPPNPELEEHAHNHFSNNRAEKKISLSYTESVGWPIGVNQFGQVTAIDINDKNNILIFHRGNHVWNERTFDSRNRYRLIDDGPIKANTIIEIDPISKKIISRWGSDLFYLPHGLTLDRNGSIWLTDVALHQVFKYPEKGAQQPILTIGERFVTGSDENHFCKPTSVAISSSNGDIYVADGYCNSRIVRFNAFGKFLNQWGHSDRIGYFLTPPPSAFSIPHKIVLIEDQKMACVADREHGRIQCFNIPNGEFQFQILREEFNGRLFSISYSKSQGLLYAVCGPSIYGSKDVSAFIFNITNQKLLAIFAPNSGSFSQPHDIAVSTDGQEAYVVEIGPNNIWKFTRSSKNEYHTDIDVQKSKNLFSFHTPIAVMSNSEHYVNKPLAIKSEEIIERTTLNVISNHKEEKTQSNSLSLPTFILSSNTSLVVSLLVIPMLILIIISIVINLRKNGQFICFKGSARSQEKYDLGRLLGDPKKDGFNRVPIDESDGDLEENSDSEVEEFNVSSASAARKV